MQVNGPRLRLGPKTRKKKNLSDISPIWTDLPLAQWVELLISISYNLCSLLKNSSRLKKGNVCFMKPKHPAINAYMTLYVHVCDKFFTGNDKNCVLNWTFSCANETNLLGMIIASTLFYSCHYCMCFVAGRVSYHCLQLWKKNYFKELYLTHHLSIKGQRTIFRSFHSRILYTFPIKHLKVWYFSPLLFSLLKIFGSEYELLCVGLISLSAILFLVEDKQCGVYPF